MSALKLQTVQVAPSAGEIDLGIGHPAAELLPKELLARASARLFANEGNDFLQYGADAGDAYFRVALATFLTEAYRLPVAPETLFVTQGVSQALDLLCASFTQPGEVVFVEEPTYFLALHIFRDHGLQIIPVPTDAEGLDTDALEALLETHSPRLVYTIPAHQNPSGVTLSRARRDHLVALAAAHDFVIVADEVYQLLNYEAETSLPFADFVDSGRVFSLGSFSKILAPGLRLGWVQTAPEHLEVLAGRGYIRSGGGLNPFTSAVVGRALELGLAEHLTHLRRTYRVRRDALAAALGSLPVSYRVPQGGYFLWLRLPEGVGADALYEVAQAHGFGFQTGTKFSSRGGLNDYVRLCFAYYDPIALAEGATRLGRSLEVVLGDAG